MVGHIGPAIANVNACKLHPCKKGRRANLVLAIVFGQSPDVSVIGFNHVGLPPRTDIKQCQMPPVVTVHKGIQVAPRVRNAFQERSTFSGLTTGQINMCKGVVGPRFVATQFHRIARRFFCIIQQVTFFISEGEHPMCIRNVFGLWHRF